MPIIDKARDNRWAWHSRKVPPGLAIWPLGGAAMNVPGTNSLKERLGIPFRDDRLLEAALVHRSALNERKDGVESNDRLEFLGDAVLGMVIAEELYRAKPFSA